MRKPLRSFSYIVLLLLVFILINVIIHYFQNFTPISLPLHYGQLSVQWDIESDAKDFDDIKLANASIPIMDPFHTTNLSLLEFIRRSNTRQQVRNEDLFGRLPSPSNPGLQAAPQSVFVIQVHSRLDNLQLLIASLKRVKHIESSLLVFSTDLISEALISTINRIRFARTLQIYFPHSVQVFPSSFPGSGPSKCSEQNASAGGKATCATEKDRFGHTRNGPLSQIKHHWLWKAQFVFKELVALRHYTGSVIFLEEDNFVVEDILVVRQLAEALWDPLHATGVISFGARLEPKQYEGNLVNTDYFISSRHNQGMGISRPMWTSIVDCLNVFCEYDDYNWDWSLQQLGRKCLKEGLRVLIFAGLSRVHHIGVCDGVHHHNANCSTSELAIKLVQKLSGPLLSQLYPTSLKVEHKHSYKNMAFRPSGGWGDSRDHLLCRSISTGAWIDSLVTMAPELTLNRSPLFG